MLSRSKILYTHFVKVNVILSHWLLSSKGLYSARAHTEMATVGNALKLIQMCVGARSAAAGGSGLVVLEAEIFQ